MVGVAVAFVIALGWSFLSVRLGSRLGLVDTPGGDALKVHERPIPLLGGIGIFAGLHVGLFLEDSFDSALLAGTTFVLVVGLVDDRIGLSPKLRLGAEAVAATILLALMDSGLDTPIGFVFGVLFVVVAINAVNLVDGLDGLVGSVTVVSGLGLAWAGAEIVGDASFGFVLSAAVAGFLVLNWQPARLFLGDHGAYTLGMVLAYGVVSSSSNSIGTMLLFVMGVMGVFFVDLGATILRRALNGRPLFTGDRGHIYDQMRDHGRPVRSIAVFAAATQGLLVLAFMGVAVAGGGLVAASVAIVLSAAIGLALLWRLGFLVPLSH